VAAASKGSGTLGRGDLRVPGQNEVAEASSLALPAHAGVLLAVCYKRRNASVAWVPCVACTPSSAGRASYRGPRGDRRGRRANQTFDAHDDAPSHRLPDPRRVCRTADGRASERGAVPPMMLLRGATWSHGCGPPWWLADGAWAQGRDHRFSVAVADGWEIRGLVPAARICWRRRGAALRGGRHQQPALQSETYEEAIGPGQTGIHPQGPTPSN